MNFEPVYLRAVLQYCDKLLYLSCLPRELQIIIGKYLLYDEHEKFKITYYNNSSIKLSVHSNFTIYELIFNKNDQLSLKIFVDKLISNESNVLSFKNEELSNFHLSDNGSYVWKNVHYNNNRLGVTYSSIYRKEDNNVIINNDEPEYMKLTMIWLKSFEAILSLNFD